MRFLEWLFLESTPALAIPLALTVFWLLVHWRRGGSARPFQISAAAMVILLSIQAWVVTPLERAQIVMSAVERDIEASRTTALRNALSANFRADEWDREQFIEFVRQMLAEAHVRSVGRNGFEIRERGAGRFVLYASYLSQMALDGNVGVLDSAWLIRFERIDGEWWIASIDPVRLNRTNIADWEQIRELR